MCKIFQKRKSKVETEDFGKRTKILPTKPMADSEASYLGK